MNLEPYEVIDPEICCAYCGQPLTIHVGYSITDVKCRNEDCQMTNVSLASTNLKEIKEQLKKRNGKK